MQFICFNKLDNTPNLYYNYGVLSKYKRLLCINIKDI
jgi:hypothetical protein